jgi:hypothetical protein
MTMRESPDKLPSHTHADMHALALRSDRAPKDFVRSRFGVKLPLLAAEPRLAKRSPRTAPQRPGTDKVVSAARGLVSLRDLRALRG